jgi:Domain of unknown function (DUF4331)
MSDHFDAEDVRTDLTDIYVFPATRPGRTVLIACFNPEPADGEANVDPQASYELKLDSDGDGQPDVAFHVLFDVSGPEATATVHRATGVEAGEAGRVGEVIVERAPVSMDAEARVTDAEGYRFFGGVRSDPHFKDIVGFRNNFQFTGNDPVASRNVIGIGLEVSNDSIGGGKPIRYWARTMASVDGELVQVDQAGRPGVNNAFNTDEEDNAAFCRSSPSGQLAAFGDKFERFLRSLGYSDEEAATLLPTYLPDWIAYDPASPSGYPNGRRLTDDTADLLAALLTRGRITSDGIGPHTDLLDEFPYLGPPRPFGAPTV